MELGAQIGHRPPRAPCSLRPRSGQEELCPPVNLPLPLKPPRSAHAPWGIKGGGWGASDLKFAAILGPGTLLRASGRTAWPALVRKSAYFLSACSGLFSGAPHPLHLCPLSRRSFGPRGVGASPLSPVGASAQPRLSSLPSNGVSCSTSPWVPVPLP